MCVNNNTPEILNITDVLFLFSIFTKVRRAGIIIPFNHIIYKAFMPQLYYLAHKEVLSVTVLLQEYL